MNQKGCQHSASSQLHRIQSLTLELFLFHPHEESPPPLISCHSTLWSRIMYQPLGYFSTFIKGFSTTLVAFSFTQIPVKTLPCRWLVQVLASKFLELSESDELYIHLVSGPQTQNYTWAVCLVTQSCLLATPRTAACQAPLSMGSLQARILE